MIHPRQMIFAAQQPTVARDDRSTASSGHSLDAADMTLDEARREAARLALGHVMSCPSFDDADALLHGFEDAGARVEVDQ